jgi:5-methylcytosine-specific restriction endonuclease McrA
MGNYRVRRRTTAETKELVFERDHWTCKHCSKPIRSEQAQLAHLIPQRKNNLRKWGKAIIHHPDNFRSACSLECNNAMQVNGPLEQERIVLYITMRIKQGYV